MTSDGQACCRKAGGKECTLAAAWAGAATPATWQGREMVGVVEEALAQQAPKHPAEPAEDGETQQEKQSTGATTSGGDEQAAGASKGDEKDQQGDSAGDKQAQGKGDAGDKEQQQQGDGQGEHKKHGKQQSADMKQDKADGDSQEGEGGKGGADSGKKNRRKEASSTDDGEDGSGKWRRATATHYTSYPPCCHDPSADQSECEDYSGCKWEGQVGGVHGPAGRAGKRASRWGPRCCPPPHRPHLALAPPVPRSLQFAGVGKKSEEWVRSHDIVGLFQAPNAENRRVRVWFARSAGRSVAGCLPVRCLGSHCLCRLTPPRSRAATGVEQPLERQAAAAEEPRDGRDHGGHGGLPGAGARSSPPAWPAPGPTALVLPSTLPVRPVSRFPSR